jgi:integrase
MAKKFDGVRQVGKDVYETNFRAIHKGKRVFKRIQAHSLQEARLKRAEAIAQYIKEEDIPQEESERRTAKLNSLAWVIENDLKSDDKGRKTINRFLLTMRRFTEFLKARHPHMQSIYKLRGPIFSDYKDYIVLELGRKKGWRAELTILKSIFGRLKKRGYCSKDVLEELKPFKRPPREEKYYRDIPKTDVRKLLSFIRQDRPDIYGIVYLIYRLGWRIDETTRLRKEDVKFLGLKPSQLLVRAQTTKTKTSRVLDVFDEELSQVVKRYVFTKQNVPWLFPTSRNNKFSGDRVRDYLKRVSQKLLGYPITPHMFRHRFCTVMGTSNIPIKDVMAISGIKDTDVLLNYYTHTTRVGKEKVIEASRLG